MRSGGIAGELKKLQIELVKLQAWVKATGARVALVFEGRDAAGEGGTIQRFREHLNPRGPRAQALGKTTDTDRTHCCLLPSTDHLPSRVARVFSSTTWYTRRAQ